jgi:hypothetical protein
MSRNQLGNDQIAALADVPSGTSLLVKRLTFDFPNLTASGGTSTTTTTVTGAAVGDGVSISNTVDPTVNMTLTGWVSAPNTVTIRATNPTAGAYDPPSQDFVITVTKVT